MDSQNERMTLCGLVAFQGGFERQAGEQIADATLPSLLALVSKSLVRRNENGRFDMHKVIRQYALSCLGNDPQKEVVQDRHSVFYLELIRDREIALKGATQREAMRELTNEIDNIRAAWTWSIKYGNFGLVGQAIRSLGRFYKVGSWLGEGIEHVETVIEVLRGKPEDQTGQKVFGAALAQQGLLYIRKGHYNQAHTLFAESLSILRPIGDPTLLTDPLIFDGIIMHLNDEVDQALSLIDECLRCSQVSGDRWSEAYALYNQGYIASLLGRYV